jgi:hypothetical protein
MPKFLEQTVWGLFYSERNYLLRISIFWDITPCPWKVSRHFGGTCALHLQVRRISQARNQREACNRALLATCFTPPNTSVDFQRATGRYIPEDRTLHNHRSENLRAYELFIIAFR